MPPDSTPQPDSYQQGVPPPPPPPPPSPRRFHLPWAAVLGAVLVLGVAGYLVGRYHGHKVASGPSPSASSTPGACMVSDKLVNSCGPWLGAAVAGNPGAAKDNVAQFQYLEQLIGRKLAIYRSYHSYPGSTSSTRDQPLNQAEISLANRAGTYLDINWNPAATWAEAAPVSAGGDPAVNANIDAVAKSIKSLAPHPVFLSLWHEANLAVDTPDANNRQCIPSANRAEGSPSQFNAAWRNVYQRFQAAGVTNVVWVMNYSSYEPRDCWVPYLWPGNQYVDWVVYDTYSKGKDWDQTAGVFYKLLEQDSSSSVDFKSKPWGIGEFGTCKQDKGISGAQYYQSVKSALDAGTYPNLKMYLVFADTGNDAGQGCLTNYDDNGQPDAAKQAAFNALAGDPVLAK